MFQKAAFWFLIILLLPACAAVSPLPPAASKPSPAVRQTDESLFLEAESSYRHQDYRRAYQDYVAYLNQYPKGPHAIDARLREAELLGLLGDWQGSLQHYQTVLSAQPEPDVALKARFGIGRAYFKLGEYQQASQVLDSLTAADLPRSLWFSTQALLAEIALKQGKVPQAFSRLCLASQDLPSGDQEWFEDLKTRFLEMATPAELEQLVSLYPNHPLTADLLLRLARLAQKAGRIDEARRWVDTLKERFPSTPEAAAGERLISGRVVRLGGLLPLSGQLSNVGFRVQRGMELAARGDQVKLVFRDTRNDPSLAATLTQELARDENILAVIGPLSSGSAQAAAEAAQGAGLPLVALSQKGGLTEVGNFIFQAFLTPKQQVQVLIRRSMAMGIKRFAILYPDSAYGRTFSQNFQEELTSQGGELITQEFYSPGTQDFEPTLASLQTALKEGEGPLKAEALFIPDDAAVVAAIAGALANSPLKGMQLMGTNLLDNERLPGSQLTVLQGAIFPDAFFAADPDPVVQKFVAAYKSKYGEDPDYLAAQGYVVIRLMEHLIGSGKSLQRADLPGQLVGLKEVANLPWFQGFDANRQEKARVYLLTIKDGRIQMVPPGPGAHATS